MKNFSIDDTFLEELDNYKQLTYLKKREIIHIYGRFKKLGKELLTDFHHRFEKSKILEGFPELSYNPFVDRIFKIFSSMKDGKMSFEDILDLASAFSEDCPVEVKAKWAFLIFDFDEDSLLNVDDIIEMVTRLTKTENEIYDTELADVDKRRVAEIVLNGSVLCHADGINCVDFVNLIKNVPEFMFAFRIKFI